jgi:septum formation protein
VNDFILASSSPRRKELLTRAGYHPTIVKPEIEEIHSTHLTAGELTQLNAHRKATWVASRYPGTWVLAADTLVALGAKIYGKPKSMEHAMEMLTELSGQTHEVVTGVCFIHRRKRKVLVDAVHTLVTFKSLSSAEIRKYLERIEPLDKAGAYAAQMEPDSIIKNIEGSFSNVVGLPMELVKRFL